ncbi:hypothetical protein [Mycobacterium intracellulare]|uniref:hypothetical protein n=1 Tax=Mycobacterium TaxID=1763 RepID=UPI001E594CE6|nr:hypothetical protein [Mycobacterium intracellulare]
MWAQPAGFTDQMVKDDSQIGKLLHTGPGFAQEVSRLLDQLKPNLPVFLVNLTTIGQIGVIYHAALEQLLMLLPPSVAAYGSYGVTNNPTGLAVGGFTLTIANPPAYTVGFLPPSSWRSPANVSEADIPDNVYCKLPQVSPLSVRGSRNYPCMSKPGKRAPTVAICNSDKKYVPLAERQHALGPFPMDPNLLPQGLPPDDRVDIEQRTFGPVEGTPSQPGRRPQEHRRGRRRRRRSTAANTARCGCRAGGAKRVWRQWLWCVTVGCSAALRPGHGAVRCAGWAVVSAVGFGVGQGGERAWSIPGGGRSVLGKRAQNRHLHR